MSSFYGTVKHGDEISPGWMQNVEDGLGSGTPAQTMEYVFWKTGTTYYCRNGTTGERDSGSDFPDLINEKILELYDATTGTGGGIWLKAGAYYYDSPINMRPGVHIYGPTRASKDTDFSVLCASLLATADTEAFVFDYPTSGTVYHSGIHNLWISGEGNVTTKANIDILASASGQNAGDIFLDDLSIGQGKYGIRLNNTHASNLIWNIFIERCFIESNTANAILLDSTTNQAIKQCRILRNHFYDNNTSSGNGALEIDGHETRGSVIAHNTWELEQVNGIYMADEADGWAISANVLIDCGEKTTNTYSGIKLVDVDYISVNGNISINRANNKMKYGYESDNNCTYCATLGNVFKGQSGGASQGTHASMRPTNASGDISNYNVCETG